MSKWSYRPPRSQAVFERAKEEADSANRVLDRDERFARDQAFNASQGADEMDGWLWNLCWTKAMEYYDS